MTIVAYRLFFKLYFDVYRLMNAFDNINNQREKNCR